MIPTNPINPGASRVNGFTVVDDELFHKGSLVKDAVSIKEGLESFLEFLEENAGENVERFVLVRYI